MTDGNLRAYVIFPIRDVTRVLCLSATESYAIERRTRLDVHAAVVPRSIVGGGITNGEKARIVFIGTADECFLWLESRTRFSTLTLYQKR